MDIWWCTNTFGRQCIYFPFHNDNVLTKLLSQFTAIMITVNVHRFIHICLQLLSPVYILCCLHVLSFSQCEYFSAHYCTIVYITMSIAYPQHILAVLFTISVPNKLTALFTYAFLFTMWIFSTHYSRIVYTQCLHWIFTDRYGTVYNYSPQYTYFPVHICYPFHNVNIFPQLLYNFLFHYVYSDASLLHAVLFTITLPSFLSLLFTYAFLFTTWYFFTITAQLTL